jgi:hypothetical protein
VLWSNEPFEPGSRVVATIVGGALVYDAARPCGWRQDDELGGDGCGLRDVAAEERDVLIPDAAATAALFLSFFLRGGAPATGGS